MTLIITREVSYNFPLPPAVILTVASTTSAPGPVPAGSNLLVWRIHEDGTEHRVITSGVPRLIGGGWVGIDYHTPYNVPVTYRAEAAGTTATVTAFVACDETWLISPDEPGKSVIIDSVKAINPRSRQTRAGEFAPVGGDALFISDGKRGGFTGSITVNATDEAPVRRLLDSDGVVLINTPGHGWRIKWMWVQFTQDDYVNEGRAHWPYEMIVLPFKQSGDPDVEQLSVWTAGEAATQLTAEGVNAGEVSALYATCLDFKINRRVS